MEGLLREFKNTHPHIKMSLTTFKRRRPRNILLSSSRKFNQCLCETCANANHLINVINKFIKIEDEKLPGIETLVRTTLCEPVSLHCIDRMCSLCGVNNFLEDLMRNIEGGDSDREVKWSRWERTEARSKDLVEKSGSLLEVMNLLDKNLKDIGKHVVFAHWQKSKYNNLRENLPRGHAMLTVDLAENYLCKFQDEVQSAHWSYRQVSVHPCGFFYRCSEKDCYKTQTEYVVFLSDELRHDSNFTMHIFDKCIQLVKGKGISILHIFSDGCSSQYKSRFTFQNLADLQKMNPDVKLTRHFFGSSHGKSMCDSSGGVVKNACTRAVASGLTVIQSAQAMYDYCSATLSVKGPIECTLHSKSFLRSFVLVKPENIPRQEKPILLPVKGTLAVHSVKFSLHGAIQVRCMSCFCDTCLLGENVQCANAALLGSWKPIHLNPQKNYVNNRSRRMNAKTKPKIADVPQTFNDHTSLPFEHFSDTFIANDPVFGPSELPNVSDINVEPAMPESEHFIPQSSSRYEFFVNLQCQLSNHSRFDELKTVVEKAIPEVGNFSMPIVTPKRLIDVGIVDKVAQDLVPDFLRPLFPVLTIADGNCLPRALSLSCFGDQDHHIEIRCRIVIELVSKCLDYLCFDSNHLNMLHMLSDCFTSDLKETFEIETMKVAHNAVHLGMWQVMAAANVIGSSIFSVYPDRGSETYRNFFTRKLLARTPTSSHTVTLLWSATLEHSNMMPDHSWTANHIVPMMGLAEFVEIEIDDINNANTNIIM